MVTQFEREIQELQQITLRLKTALTQKFSELPDNPRIKRLSQNAFVISSTDLANNWSVEFHDFPRQYRFIQSELLRKEPAYILPFLKEIVTEGKVRDRDGKCYVKFHPDVIGFVKFITQYAPIENVPEDMLLKVVWGEIPNLEYGIAKYVHGKWWNYTSAHPHACGRECATPTGWAGMYEF